MKTNSIKNLKGITFSFLLILIISLIVYFISIRLSYLFSSEINNQIFFIVIMTSGVIGNLSGIIQIYLFFRNRRIPDQLPQEVQNVSIEIDQTGETNVTASRIQAEQIGGTSTLIQHVEHLYLNDGRTTHSIERQESKYPPLQLPDPPLRFRDRKRELEHLLSHIKPGAIYTLCSPGGMGKTDLVSKALHTLTDGVTPPAEFPDGVIFHTFYKQTSLDLALDHIARAYNEEPKPTLLEAARRTLAGRQALLVLDGAEDAEHLDAILGIRGRCCVIITSRDRAHLVDCGIYLDPLKQTEGLALLADWGKEYARDPDAARRVWELVGGLSLALRIAGQYMSSTKTPTPEYAHLLELSPLSEILQLEERRLQSVPVLLDYCLDQVNEDARSVFATTSLLAFSPFPHQWISVALDFEDSRTALAIGELVRFGLLQRYGDAYQLTHILLHTYACQKTTPPSSSLEKLATYFEQFVRQESEKGLPGYTELNKVYSHIIFLLERLENNNKLQNLLDLAWSVQNYLLLQGHSTELQLVCLRALHVAQESDDKYVEGAWLGNLGLAYDNLGDPQKALQYHKQAVELARQIGDRYGEAASLGNLGTTYFVLGYPRTAIDYHQQALEINRQIEDRHGEGSNLGNLGLAHRELGELYPAIEYHEQSLRIFQEIGDLRAEGQELDNLGLAYRNLCLRYATIEYLEKSNEYHEMSLHIFKKIGDKRSEGLTLLNMGVNYAELGKPEKAIEYYQESLDIFCHIGDRLSEASSLNNLGRIYIDLRDNLRARSCLEQALFIREHLLPPDHPEIQKVRDNLKRLDSQILNPKS